MAHSRLSEPSSSSASPSPRPPLLQKQLKLLACRAPLSDVSVCVAVAAVAGVDLCLLNSPSTGASHSPAAGRAGVTYQRSSEASETTARETPSKNARAQPRLSAADEFSSSSAFTLPGGGAVADSDTCLLLTEKGSIRSAYAICLYLTSQAATEEARETLLPSSAVTISGNSEQQHELNNTNSIDIATAAKKKWLVENWLAWAAFTFKAAVRGVRKDVILRQLDFLEQHIETSPAFAGLSLPAMFTCTALRYSFPGSSFSDWPAIAKWLAGVCACPVFGVVSRLVPPPAFVTSRELRRADLLLPIPRIAHRTRQWKDTTALQKGKEDIFEQAVPNGDVSASEVSTKNNDGDGSGLEGTERETYYLTSAINYTNGPPHMGHVYEAVAADVIARYHRVYGRDVYFLTGTDEHGQKIANAAALQGKQPLELCDIYVEKFKDLNRQLAISYDFFIRTTMPEHKNICCWIWERVKANGDIYLDTYKGWYNEREETFVSEQDARAADYKDPVSGKPLQQMAEPSYFFRMSKYQHRLVEHINQNPDFILPEKRRKHILKRLEEPLLDLSCSRNTFSWGVPVPNDPSHVMYVWFDALTNYISGKILYRKMKDVHEFLYLEQRPHFWA